MMKYLKLTRVSSVRLPNREDTIKGRVERKKTTKVILKGKQDNVECFEAIKLNT